MSNNSSRGRVVPSRQVHGEPITDPAEIAAIEASHKAFWDSIVPLVPPGAQSPLPITEPVARLLDLARQLSPEERLSFLAHLLPQLTPDRQDEWFGHLTA